jgi:hypothetical protein
MFIIAIFVCPFEKRIQKTTTKEISKEAPLTVTIFLLYFFGKNLTLLEFSVDPT